MGYIGVALEKIKHAPGADAASLKIEDDLRAAEKGVIFCNDVVSELLKFARPSDLDTEPVDINELVDDTLKFVSVELVKARVRVELHLGARLPKIMADANQLKQVLSTSCSTRCRPWTMSRTSSASRRNCTTNTARSRFTSVSPTPGKA
jgi:signal transduction histidine kinase